MLPHWVDARERCIGKSGLILKNPCNNSPLVAQTPCKATPYPTLPTLYQCRRHRRRHPARVLPSHFKPRTYYGEIRYGRVTEPRCPHSRL